MRDSTTGFSLRLRDMHPTLREPERRTLLPPCRRPRCPNARDQKEINGLTRGVHIHGTVWHRMTTMSDHTGDRQWPEHAGIPTAVTVRDRCGEHVGSR